MGRENEKRWIDSQMARLLILTAFAAVTIWLTFFAYPPSHLQPERKQDDVSEWLGWIGLAGLVIAVWQLLKTRDAAESARRSALATTSKLSASIASQYLSDAMLVANEVVPALKASEFDRAHRSSAAVIRELAKVQPRLNKIDTALSKQIGDISAELVETRIASGGWITQAPADASFVQKQIELVEAQLVALTGVQAELRINSEEVQNG